MRTLMTAVAVAALAGSTAADRLTNYAPTDFRSAASLTAQARGFADLSQDFETFPSGPFVSPTQGWETTFDAVFSVGPGLDGQALNYAADGEGSLDFTDTLFSPRDPTPNLGTISADIAADSLANSYGFTPVAPDTGFIVTRVLLDIDGTIDVLQADTSDPQNPVPVLTDTPLTWAVGEINDVAVTLAGDGTFTVSNNGVDSGLIFTDVSFTLTGVLTPGYDSLAVDFFNQTAGPLAFVDNVRFVPTPGALAMLGLGGLAAARRRRA